MPLIKVEKLELPNDRISFTVQELEGYGVKVPRSKRKRFYIDTNTFLENAVRYTLMLFKRSKITLKHYYRDATALPKSVDRPRRGEKVSVNSR